MWKLALAAGAFLVLTAPATAAVNHPNYFALVNKVLDTKPIDPPRLVVGQEEITALGDRITPHVTLKSKRDAWRQVARHRGSSAPVSVPVTGCTKPDAVDFSGTPTNCADATQNPSFIWTTFFDDARQSGQAEYYWNYDTIPYDVACVHVGCGYDTTKLVNEPIEISFVASTASVSGGVLTVNPLDLDANNGVVAVDQYLICSGCPTSPRVKITSQISPTEWQTDDPSLTLSARAISASRFPHLSCDFFTSQGGISTTPIVACNTTGDSSTPTLIEGYDFDEVWLNITVGGGAGSNGEAGPITITHSRFTCSPENQYTSIVTALNTHFDLYITHNEHDGRYPTCTGQAFLNNKTVGTPSKSQIARVEWNALINEGVLPMAGSGSSVQGGGYYTYLTVARNAIASTNLSGAFHGAVYALSLADYMYQYDYIQNLALAYPAAAPAGLGTTTFSMLALASRDHMTRVETMRFLGNISVTNIPSTSQPLAACSTNSALTATQTALWKNVGMNSFGTFVSRGNLTDPTGATGCGIYHNGLSAIGTASLDGGPDANDGLTTMTMTVNSGNLLQNARIHVNATTGQACGTIVADGNGTTGTMTLDTATAGCPSLGTPRFGLGSGVSGLIEPGLYVSAVITPNSVYRIRNTYCSGTASCTPEQLSATRQFLYGACSLMPIGTVDPNTGSPSTGTGLNTGTYMLACEQTDVSRSSYRQYNSTLDSIPQANDGTDMNLITGNGTYFGGFDWAYGLAP